MRRIPAASRSPGTLSDPPVSMRFTLLLLRGHPLRIALAVASIALAIAVTCAIGTIERSVVSAFATVVHDMAGRTTLVVTAPGGGLFPADVVHLVATVAGVDTAVPVRVESASEPGGTEPLVVHGFDFARERYLRVYDRHGVTMRYGELIDVIEAGDSIMVSRAFAERRGLGLGDPLVLETPHGERRFVIRRVLALEGLAGLFGGNAAVMDPQTMAAAFGAPDQANRIDVAVRIREDLATVQAAIARVLPLGLQVASPLSRRVDLGRVVRSFQVLLWSVAALAVALCALVTYHALATHFEGQAWESAVLRAVGMRTRRAWWELMKESLALGIAGTLLGLPLGVLLGHVLLPAVAGAAAVSHRLAAAPATLIVTPWTVGLATAIGFAAAALSAAVPTWQASRVSIAGALQRRGLPAIAGNGLSRWMPAIVAGALAATLAAARVVAGPLLGFVATALVALLTALVARPLLERLAPALRAVAERAGGRAGMLPAANLLAHTRRTALALAVLGVGIGCVVWLRVVATSFERTLVEALAETMRAELIVASPRNAGGWVPAPVDAGIVARLREVPAVAAVAANRLADVAYQDATVAINAFDPDYFRDGGFGRPHLHGSHAADVWERLADGTGVIASTNLLMNFRVAVGDVLRLATPSGPLELPIVGATLAFASPSGTVEMSRALYAERWHDAAVNRVWVRTQPALDVAAARDAIARAVGREFGVHVFTSHEMLDHLAAQARRAFAPVAVVEGIVLVIVLIGIGDALASAVLERTRAIGIARAVGVRRRDVARMVTAEALVLAALGLVLGVAAGLALGALWVHATLPGLLGWMVELHAPWPRIALVAVVTLVVAAVAAVLPARSAARLEAAEALRYE